MIAQLINKLKQSRIRMAPTIICTKTGFRAGFMNNGCWIVNKLQQYFSRDKRERKTYQGSCSENTFLVGLKS